MTDKSFEGTMQNYIHYYVEFDVNPEFSESDYVRITISQDSPAVNYSNGELL